MKTCPRCLSEHTGRGTFCSNACAKTVDKVPVVCQTCRRTVYHVPSIAKKRKYCSPSCASAGTKNCSRESCRIGGLEAAKARFAAWWESMMRRVSTSALTPAEAFRAGYLVGHRRGYRRAKRLDEAAREA